jgi:hypothetical protein
MEVVCEVRSVENEVCGIVGLAWGSSPKLLEADSVPVVDACEAKEVLIGGSGCGS